MAAWDDDEQAICLRIVVPKDDLKLTRESCLKNFVTTPYGGRLTLSDILNHGETSLIQMLIKTPLNGYFP